MFNAGASAPSVARLLGVSDDSAKRHRSRGHVSPASSVAFPVAASRDTPAYAIARRDSTDAVGAGPIDAVTARDEFDFIKAELGRMLAANPSPNQRLGILAEHRRTVEARSRVVGPEPSAPTSYRDLEGWAEMEACIFRTLEQYPDARFALADAIAGLEKEEHEHGRDDEHEHD